MKDKEYNSEEVKFIHKILKEEGIFDLKNPIVGTVMSQVFKLLEILDKDKNTHGKIRSILNRIQREWNVNTN